MAAIVIRPARADEAARLGALCMRSKAVWGYDAAFMAKVAPGLAIAPEAIAHGRVLVAEDGAAVLLGVAAWAPTGDPACADLAQLFVSPEAIGRGVGRALFAAISRLAAASGAARMTILADPHAAAFYARLGAEPRGEAPSDAIPGRRLPLLEYRLRAAH